MAPPTGGGLIQIAAGACPACAPCFTFRRIAVIRAAIEQYAVFGIFLALLVIIDFNTKCMH
jgi:hypothetical protein